MAEKLEESEGAARALEFVRMQKELMEELVQQRVQPLLDRIVALEQRLDALERNVRP